MVQQNTQPYFLYNDGPYNDPRTQHQNREYRHRSPSLYDMIPNEQNNVSEATHPQAAGRLQNPVIPPSYGRTSISMNMRYLSGECQNKGVQWPPWLLYGC